MDPATLVDLFDLSDQPSDSTVELMCTLIESLGFNIHKMRSFGVEMAFKYTMPLIESMGVVEGSLVINRLRKTYRMENQVQYGQNTTQSFRAAGLLDNHLRNMVRSLEHSANDILRIFLVEAKNTNTERGLASKFNNLSTGTRKALYMILKKYAKSGTFVYAPHELSELGATPDQVEALLEEMVAIGFSMKTDDGYRFSRQKLDSLIELGILALKGDYIL